MEEGIIGEDRAEAGELAVSALSELLVLMGASVEVEIVEPEAVAGVDRESESLTLSLVGDEAEQWIGEKGETLDAMQFFTTRIVSRRMGRHYRIIVDANGYRDQRERSLIELAEQLADKALAEQNVIALNPLNGRDRRVIHMALRERVGVDTRSEGDRDDRRLLIVPC